MTPERLSELLKDHCADILPELERAKVRVDAGSDNWLDIAKASLSEPWGVDPTVHRFDMTRLVRALDLALVELYCHGQEYSHNSRAAVERIEKGQF